MHSSKSKWKCLTVRKTWRSIINWKVVASLKLLFKMFDMIDRWTIQKWMQYHWWVNITNQLRQKYRPTVYPILNLSLRGVNIIYPAPGRWSLLGEGASPRRCQCSRGLQGARKLSKAPRTPRKKHDMTSNQPNKKEIVSGRPRGRPYSAWYVSDAHLKA